MSVTPINTNYSNITEFVNSLFNQGVRTEDVINQAISNNQFLASFSDQGSKIISVWLAAWQASQGDAYDSNDFAHCPPGDIPLIAYLANYIKENTLVMSIPQIEFLAETDKGPKYQLQSYESQSFLDNSGNWNYKVVSNFLNLLMYGAHFVTIHSTQNLPNGPTVVPLWTDFQTAPALKEKERRDIATTAGVETLGNSHYTSVTNFNGYYYPSIAEDTAPNPCPFFLSFLVCPTIGKIGGPGDNESYNTFFQLEGWELPPKAIKAANSRHSADYELYQQTYWNISTYGACAYSEKRGTAIFLAPENWVPVPTPETIMPPYTGAETPQPWLQTSLVTL